MAGSDRLTGRHTTTLGDAAVDGLLNGGLAGLAMALYLVVVGMFLGEAPGGVLAYFDLRPDAQPVTGALLHLAVSGIYGALFESAYQLTAHRFWNFRPAWLSAMLGGFYGLALFMVAQVAILPDGGAALRHIPTPHFVLAHGIFGICLGLLTFRSRRQSLANAPI